jgi:hypothetical protein
MTPHLDRGAEYAMAADAWRAFCQGATNADPAGQPLAIVLLAGLCEPPDYGARFTGDVIADVLGGLRGFVDRIERDAADGGGGGLFIHNPAIEAWQRKLSAALALRAYERASCEKGGAP